MTVYYNEFDPKIANWLRELIKMKVIAEGEVDDRSMLDISVNDLKGFTQHHFFAGIGTWSYALRNAGWSDDRPVWTASLPCQPFSVAGNQKGKQDERHLLPHFVELVKQFRPNTIFGEQVEAAIRHGWLDDLQTTMEAEGYAIGHTILGTHSVNAAHQRQRLYWVANTEQSGQQGWLSGRGNPKWENIDGHIGRGGSNSRLGNTEHNGLNADTLRRSTSESEAKSGLLKPERPNPLGRLGNAKHDGSSTSKKQRSNESSVFCSKEGQDSSSKPKRAGSSSFISSISEESVEWLYCRDNKYRPIKSGIKPLVDGAARGVVYSGGEINANNTGLERAMRLKGYGNAINADVAQLFIEVFLK